MRRVLIVLALLLLPSALWAQGALQVTSVNGPVQWRAAASKTFVPLTRSAIQVGDELRTGDGASVILTVPDGSYMVVSENSKLVIEDFWSGSVRSIMNLMMGEVRFYIQRFGGRPNPYSVRTPTALIAVRGTIFDVNVDAAQIVEVQCLEGRVTVENGREVILEPNFKTLVRPNEYPTTPVRLDAELKKDRVIEMRKVSAPESDSNSAPSLDILLTGNDRGNRPSDPQFGSNSRAIDNTQRAKPSLTFP
ncbi:MAG TPA: FecR domain-containing protein [Terriglobia bacterium]|jgi:hypothetical protein